MNTPYNEIVKSFTREATPEELKQIETWVNASVENKVIYKQLLKIWKLDKAFHFETDTVVSWQKLQNAIEQKKYSQRKTIRFKQWLPYAAAIALILTIGAFFFTPSKTIEYLSVTILDAQREVVLPDGTKVHLNKYSEFSYPKTFDEEQRNVRLKGEAFFEVAKNPLQPFVIKTLQTTTKVLGTSFNLRAYPQENKEIINVATGKVAFSSLQTQEKVLLVANQKGVYDKSKQRVRKSLSNNPNYKAWYDKQFIFDDETFSSVLECLSQSYRVSFKVNHPNLTNERLSVTFEGLKLSEIMDILAVTLQFDYTINNNIVIIK